MCISIVIPTTSPEKLLQNLEDLRARFQTISKTLEFIIVADGCCGDDFFSDDLIIVYNSRLKGSYSSRNRGAELASHDILLFCDDEIVIKINPSFSIPDEEHFIMGSNVSFIERPRDHYQLWYVQNAFNVKNFLNKFNFIPTIFLMLRKKDFFEIGMFNGDLVSSGDVDFCKRASDLCEFMISKDVQVYTSIREKKQIFKKLKRQIYGQCYLKRINSAYLDYFVYISTRLVKNFLTISGTVRKIEGFSFIISIFVNMAICYYKVFLLTSCIFTSKTNLHKKSLVSNSVEISE